MENSALGEGRLSPQNYRKVAEGKEPLLGARRDRSRRSIKTVRNRETVRIGVGNPTNVFNYPGTMEITKQRTIDVNHGNFRGLLSMIREYERTFGRKLGTVADVGGEFSTTKYEYRDGGQNVALHTGTPSTTIERTFTGRLQAYSYDSSVWPSIDPIDQIALHAYGNKARALVNPANPSTSVAVGAGELREVQGIPGIPGLALFKERLRLLENFNPYNVSRNFNAATGVIKAGSSEYLNLQFGWLSLERDLRAAAQLTLEHIQLLKQYERSRGRAVRRRYEFPVEEPTLTTVDMGSKAPAPSISSAFFSTYQGHLTRVEEFSQRVWFSGSFTYYVTPGLSQSKLSRYEAAANKLLGSRLTPHLVWQLAPWTWLTDWFVDFGTFISNLEAMVLDGSVMWYGYVMATQQRSHTYHLTGSRLQGGSELLLEQQFTAVTKQRVRATPFGFGLSPNTDFSMKQWTILAALGITRA